jgi:hypothetical protein
MSKIIMKEATPAKWNSLCEACRWGHIRTGFRESEMEVICTDVVPNVPVAFKVRECSSYLHKTRPTWEQMKDLAINVTPRGFRVLGFQAEADVENEDVEAAPS